LAFIYATEGAIYQFSAELVASQLFISTFANLLKTILESGFL